MNSKKFVRLNINDNYLSFGNVFRVIKEESNNYNTFIQQDLFSILFNTYDIADSTVNNYCTGLRAINPIYKKYFENIKKIYKENNNVLINTVTKILELVENKETDIYSKSELNKNIKLKNICMKLYSISKNDQDVNIEMSSKLYKYLEESKLYDFISEVLFYVILEKKQPIYIDEKLNDIIEKNIYNTNISINSIQEYIKLQLNSGIWSVREIRELAKKNNPFACFEVASMEYYGIITGKSRPNEAYKFYKVAAEFNHPVANWAIGYLYYQGHIGNRERKDLSLAFKYFNKARKLKCSNAYNSLGLICLNGDIPHIGKNKTKAIEFFNQALLLGNVYAYNNLGKIYEEEHNYKKAFEYYIISANQGESWAANKVGEFYRNGFNRKKDLKKAFEYYNISSDSPKFTLCKWSKYNLAKYFYEYGNLEIGINRDINKALELLDDVSDDLIDASEELIYIYYELFLKSNKENSGYLDKVMFYKEICEKNIGYNNIIKKRIENKLKNIFSDADPINLP